MSKEQNHLILINSVYTVYMHNIFDDLLNFNSDLLTILTSNKIETFDLTLSDGNKSHTFDNIVRNNCVINYDKLIKKKKILSVNDILNIIK